MLSIYPLNWTTLVYKSEKKKKENDNDPLLHMHTDTNSHTYTGCYMGGNSVNIYAPLQSWASPGMRGEINPKHEHGPVVSFIDLTTVNVSRRRLFCSQYCVADFQLCAWQCLAVRFLLWISKHTDAQLHNLRRYEEKQTKKSYLKLHSQAVISGVLMFNLGFYLPSTVSCLFYRISWIMEG